MNLSNIYTRAAFLLLLNFGLLTGCQSSQTPTKTTNAAATEETEPAVPLKRVDVRGTIIRKVYDQGQVTLEVEGITSQYSRFTRAYVLVTPITQIIGLDGKTLSMNELFEGQNVAILLRGGGQGNLTGVGVARKLWLEERY
ncbi:hypothetical protein GU926_11730 [Nibribacter ruber]|uniref:DUF5666 domain-containing protein n=1 Tax=Nibribacter ruber TaxID=2698458 RepID=A0A6P1NZV0_9BACT|nr:hypothetical protein [Nibribacter ruber]QHL88064.1 hypothetical protein GU926_11730 [Nibribacter ruber]